MSSKYIGQTYGTLTIQEIAVVPSPSGSRTQYAITTCTCGGSRRIRLAQLQQAANPTCALCKPGPEFRKHKLQATWRAMLDRCKNPKSALWRYYGGRGIDVCYEWYKRGHPSGFEQFLTDMGERPEGMSLDRIDNIKGYSKENCRWADTHTQANNTSRTQRATIAGLNMTASEWSARLGVNNQAMHVPGYSLEEVVRAIIGANGRNINWARQKAEIYLAL